MGERQLHFNRQNKTNKYKRKRLEEKDKKKQMRAKSCQQCGNQGPTTEHARRSLIKLRLA